MEKYFSQHRPLSLTWNVVSLYIFCCQHLSLPMPPSYYQGFKHLQGHHFLKQSIATYTDIKALYTLYTLK